MKVCCNLLVLVFMFIMVFYVYDIVEIVCGECCGILFYICICVFGCLMNGSVFVF